MHQPNNAHKGEDFARPNENAPGLTETEGAIRSAIHKENIDDFDILVPLLQWLAIVVMAVLAYLSMAYGVGVQP